MTTTKLLLITQLLIYCPGRPMLHLLKIACPWTLFAVILYMTPSPLQFNQALSLLRFLAKLSVPDLPALPLCLRVCNRVICFDSHNKEP